MIEDSVTLQDLIGGQAPPVSIEPKNSAGEVSVSDLIGSPSAKKSIYTPTTPHPSPATFAGKTPGSIAEAAASSEGSWVDANVNAAMKGMFRGAWSPEEQRIADEKASLYEQNHGALWNMVAEATGDILGDLPAEIGAYIATGGFAKGAQAAAKAFKSGSKARKNLLRAAQISKKVQRLYTGDWKGKKGIGKYLVADALAGSTVAATSMATQEAMGYRNSADEIASRIIGEGLGGAALGGGARLVGHALKSFIAKAPTAEVKSKLKEVGIEGKEADAVIENAKYSISQVGKAEQTSQYKNAPDSGRKQLEADTGEYLANKDPNAVDVDNVHPQDNGLGGTLDVLASAKKGGDIANDVGFTPEKIDSMLKADIEGEAGKRWDDILDDDYGDIDPEVAKRAVGTDIKESIDGVYKDANDKLYIDHNKAADSTLKDHGIDKESFTPEKQAFIKLVDSLGDDYKVVHPLDGNEFDGAYYIKDGQVHIMAPDDLNIGEGFAALGHEGTHKALAELPKSTYTRLFKAVNDTLKTTEGMLDEYKSWITKRGKDWEAYSSGKASDSLGLMEEFLAERGGARTMALKEKMFSKFKEDSPEEYKTLIDHVKSYVKKIIAKFKDSIGIKTANSANQFEELNGIVDALVKTQFGEGVADDVAKAISKAEAQMELNRKVAAAPDKYTTLDAETFGINKENVGKALPEQEPITMEEADANRTKVYGMVKKLAEKAIEGVKKSDTYKMGDRALKAAYHNAYIRGMTSVATDLKEFGLDGLNDMYKRVAEPSRDLAYRHLSELGGSLRKKYGVTPEILGRRESTKVNSFKIGGKEYSMTNSDMIDLVMHSRDKTAGKPNEKTGFGSHSNANVLVQEGFKDSKGNVHKFTVDQVHELALEDGVIGEFQGYTQYLRELTDEYGKLYDIAAKKAGSSTLITDKTNDAYWGALYQNVTELRKSGKNDSSKLFHSLADARQLHKRTSGSNGPLIARDTELRMSQATRHASDTYGMVDADSVMTLLFAKKDHKVDTGVFEYDGDGPGKEVTAKIDSLYKHIKEMPYGTERWETLVEKLSNQQDYKTADDMHWLVTWANRMLTRGALAFKATTPVIQLGSAPLGSKFLKGTTAEQLGKIKTGLTDMAKSPKKTANEMYKYSDYAYRRKHGMMSTEQAELINKIGTVEALKKIKHVRNIMDFAKYVGDVFDSGMGMIRYMDEMTIGGLWNAAKADLDLKGVDLSTIGPEKLRELNELFYDMIETQPSDIRRLKNGFQLSDNPLTRTLTIFSSPAARQFEVGRDAVVEFTKSDKTSADVAKLGAMLAPVAIASAYVTVAGTTVGGAKRWVLNDEERRKKIEAAYSTGNMALSRALHTTIGTVPLVGNIASEWMSAALTGKHFDTEVPLLELVNGTMDLTASLAHGKASEVRRALKTVSTHRGLPRGLFDVADAALRNIKD